MSEFPYCPACYDSPDRRDQVMVPIEQAGTKVWACLEKECCFYIYLASNGPRYGKKESKKSEAVILDIHLDPLGEGKHAGAGVFLVKSKT